MEILGQELESGSQGVSTEVVVSQWGLTGFKTAKIFIGWLA